MQIEESSTAIRDAIGALKQHDAVFKQLGLDKLSGDDLADGIRKALWRPFINSTNRADEMLYLTAFVESDVFWKVFQERWPGCDDTWHLNDDLIETLQYHSDCGRWSLMNDQQRRFFDSLPDVVTVHRGCSHERVRGVSWTTDREVAQGFARGHRFVGRSNRALAKAKIRKGGIFTVILNRDESEIVLDPYALRNLRVTPYPTALESTA